MCSLSRLFVGALASLFAVAAGCGAKTGLRLPDVAPEAAVCVPGTYALVRRSADVVFVIDRSTSMEWGLEGGAMGRPSRWEVLRSVLGPALLPFQSTLNMGAAFFPQPPSGSMNIEEYCIANTRLDVEPGPNNAGAILSILNGTEPNGGTPTHDALTVVTNYLRGRAARGRARYIVLATDGGPNCNGALDYRTCVCTRLDDAGNPTCALNPDQRYNCLDDTRTLRLIAENARQGIPTYVIGIDDPTRPDLTAVLNAMAVAGGRPNTGAGRERYYSVRRAQDLSNAFQAIQNAIARCAFVTPTQPDDPDAVEILVDGTPVARDPSRTEGWDWTDRDYGEITFFGRVCSSLMPASTVTARIPCRDAGT